MHLPVTHQPGGQPVTARQPVNGHRASPPGRTTDWAAFGYRPDPRTPLLRCRCGGAYLDDGPSRAAHRTVFGHQPREPEGDSSALGT